MWGRAGGERACDPICWAGPRPGSAQWWRLEVHWERSLHTPPATDDDHGLPAGNQPWKPTHRSKMLFSDMRWWINRISSRLRMPSYDIRHVGKNCATYFRTGTATLRIADDDIHRQNGLVALRGCSRSCTKIPSPYGSRKRPSFPPLF